MATITIDSKTFGDWLRAMLCAASTDLTRAHLSCIRIETHGRTVRMIATDGHWMLCTERDIKPEDMTGKDAIVHLNREDAERIVKVLPKKGVVSFDADGNVTDARTTTVLGSFKPADVTFPPYEQVIPCSAPTKENERAHTHVASTLLAAVVKGFQLLRGDKRDIGLRIEYGMAELDPMLVTASIPDVTALAVVMPFRADDKHFGPLIARFRNEKADVKAAAE